jgi:hypothetical protein
MVASMATLPPVLDSSLDKSVKGSLVSTTNQDVGAHAQIFSATLIQCVIAKKMKY